MIPAYVVMLVMISYGLWVPRGGGLLCSRPTHLIKPDRVDAEHLRYSAGVLSPRGSSASLCVSNEMLVHPPESPGRLVPPDFCQARLLSLCSHLKHYTFMQCWVNVGSPSTTVGQHQPNVVLTMTFTQRWVHLTTLKYLWTMEIKGFFLIWNVKSS